MLIFIIDTINMVDGKLELEELLGTKTSILEHLVSKLFTLFLKYQIFNLV